MYRSWLFVPGDSEKMLAKASALESDALVFDLEDAVTPSRKALARQMVGAQLSEVSVGHAARWVRINALDTGLAEEDLAAVMPGRPDGIVLPKAEQGAQADHLARMLERLEAENGIDAGHTRLALIAFESPAGVLNAASYQTLNPRVCGLSWGAEDLAAGIGASAARDADGHYHFPHQLARSLCLMAAGAAQVQAVDTAFTDFRDLEGLATSCRQARIDGFTGKLAIHPAQLPVIHASFTPGAEEIAEAQAVVAAFAAQPEAGTVGLDGRMLDRPHLRRARRVLALAGRQA